MKTMKQLIEQRPRAPITVSPDDSVFSALELMAKHDIGAVMAMQGTRLAGIFSERDYARKIMLHGKSSKETLVREIMSDRVAYVTPATTLDECMALMTDNRLRHLPVMDGGKLLGMVSIGDLVKDIISEQQFIIEQLEHYITGQRD